MGNPLDFEPVKPSVENRDSTPIKEVDSRPFWRRILSSLRVTANVETDKKTGKRVGSAQITGGTDF